MWGMVCSVRLPFPLASACALLRRPRTARYCRCVVKCSRSHAQRARSCQARLQFAALQVAGSRIACTSPSSGMIHCPTDLAGADRKPQIALSDSLSFDAEILRSI
eukprot:6208900-Pleurochrysis_carterae.AAC.2